ncbi:MAG: hypothetical protein CME93_03880 [Hyphomonadaceae bacterium]|nr:hypothetical protein [Hyphomonadaceae bacterium]OUX94532.1 MAG: hypothetical protein CBB77_05455 [Hyphomonas sp. TMED17]
MPENSPSSPSAVAIACGTLRLLTDYGAAGLYEVTLGNGRRADVLAIDASGQITIVEIKSSVNDFKSDQKWPEYLPYCDRFYFAVSEDFPADLIPDNAGLIIADQFGGAIMRSAPETKLSPARRRSLTLRFARLAANRFNQQSQMRILDSRPYAA